MVLQIQNESTPLVGTIPTANPLLQRSSQRQHVVHSPLPGDSDDISCAGQPLLQRDQHQYDHPSAGAAPTLAPGVFTRHALITLIILGTILFVLEAGNYISMAPQRAIFEQIVCDGYYVAFNGGKKRAADLSVLRGGGPDAIDERCKIEPVQSEVAFVSEWLDTFQMIPGIVLAVPYGALADRYGRKTIMSIALVGLVLAEAWVKIISWYSNIFPLRAVWFSGFFCFLGGGTTTLSSLLFVMVADVCPPNRRTAAFSQLYACMYLAELLAVPIGAELMKVHPWIAFVASTVSIVIGLILAIIFVRETFPVSVGPQQQINTLEGGDTDWQRADVKTLRLRAHQALKGVAEGAQWISHNISVMLVLSTFLFCTFDRKALDILLQYVAKKFHWSYAKASYLISFRAAFNLVTLILIIPTLSDLFISRLGMSRDVTDKRLTEITGIFLIAGGFLTFLAAAPPALLAGQAFFALGMAFSATARSLVTSMVEQNHLSMVFTGIAVFIQIGAVIGGPLNALLFKYGMELGGPWIGLPFLVAALLSAIAVMLVFAAQVRCKEEDFEPVVEPESECEVPQYGTIASVT